MSIILKASYSDDFELNFVVDRLDPHVESVKANGIRNTKKGIFRGAKIVIKDIPIGTETPTKYSNSS